VGGQEVRPAFAEHRRLDFLGDYYVTERVIGLPLRHGQEALELRLDGQPARVSVRGENCSGPVTVARLLAEMGRL